jgi:hypothetical protein
MAAVCAIVLAVSPAQAQNLLDDGSFNLATAGGQTSNSAWTLNVDFPDPGAPLDGSAQFQGGFANAENGSGGPGDGGTGIWFKSFLGMRGGNAAIPTANADITQTVVAPYSGNFTLNFVAGREANFTAERFEVEFSSSGTGGSALVDLLAAAITPGNIGGAASPNLGGTPFSLSLSGVTAGDMLTVTGRMVDGIDFNMPGGQSAFLDRFSLVPEPSSAALGLFVILGLVGVARRR